MLIFRQYLHEYFLGKWVLAFAVEELVHKMRCLVELDAIVRLDQISSEPNETNVLQMQGRFDPLGYVRPHPPSKVVIVDIEALEMW